MNFLKFGSSKKYIVFLHGWGSDMNSFLWTKNFFKEFSLLFVDFWGFGKSPEPERAYAVVDYANDLKNILDSFEIEELVLVGHSFGGRVSIKFASLFQDFYPSFKLCLVDSAGVLPKRNLRYYFSVFRYKRLKNKVRKSPKEEVKLSKFGSSDYKKLSPVMKKTFVKVVNEDLCFDAKNIKAETFIIWGRNDQETKIFMAKKLHRLIKNSKLFVFKNAGHFSFLDDKQEFLILLDTLCKNL
ncbi:MAG: alpha/beta hydrolase [Clostridia bacterium]|nr:alpha/beta hydrolase [Clostridia bacterium]